MAQFLRPDSNIQQTNFTNGFANIDEASPSDADFAFGTNNTVAVLEVTVSDPSGTPGAGTCTVRYRIAKTNAGTVDGGGNAVTVTGEVLEGAAQIAIDSARTATGTWTEYTFTFDVSAVTNWNDLRLQFTTSASGGSPANRRGGAVSWAEIETPDAAVAVVEHDDPPEIFGARAAIAAGLALVAGMTSAAIGQQRVSFANEDYVAPVINVVFEDDQGPRRSIIGPYSTIRILKGGGGPSGEQSAAPLGIDEEYGPRKVVTGPQWTVRVGPPTGSGAVPEAIFGPVDEQYALDLNPLIAYQNSLGPIIWYLDGTDVLPLLFTTVDNEDYWQASIKWPVKYNLHQLFVTDEVPTAAAPSVVEDEDYWLKPVLWSVKHNIRQLFDSDEVPTFVAPTIVDDSGDISLRVLSIGQEAKLVVFAAGGSVIVDTTAPPIIADEQPSLIVWSVKYQQLSLFDDGDLPTAAVVTIVDEEYQLPSVTWPVRYTLPSASLFEQNDTIGLTVEDDPGYRPLVLWPVKYIQPTPWFEQNDTFGLTVEETYNLPTVIQRIDRSTSLVLFDDGDLPITPTVGSPEEYYQLPIVLWPNKYAVVNPILYEQNDVIGLTVSEDYNFVVVTQRIDRSTLPALFDDGDLPITPVVGPPEEYYQLPTVLWSNKYSVVNPVLYEQNDVIGLTTQDDYVLPVITWKISNIVLPWFGDEEVVTPPPPLAVDEDIAWNYPVTWPVKYNRINFFGDEEAVTPPTPLSIDEDYPWTRPTIWPVKYNVLLWNGDLERVVPVSPVIPPGPPDSPFTPEDDICGTVEEITARGSDAPVDVFSPEEIGVSGGTTLINTDVREFYDEFNTLTRVLSDHASLVRRPDAITSDYLIAHTTGPIAIDDDSAGVESHIWYAEARYDSTTDVTNIYCARANDTNNGWNAETLVVSFSGVATEIDVAFDKDAHIVITVERAGEVWLYWYDPAIPSGSPDEIIVWDEDFGLFVDTPDLMSTYSENDPENLAVFTLSSTQVYNTTKSVKIDQTGNPASGAGVLSVIQRVISGLVPGRTYRQYWWDYAEDSGWGLPVGVWTQTGPTNRVANGSGEVTVRVGFATTGPGTVLGDVKYTGDTWLTDTEGYVFQNMGEGRTPRLVLDEPDDLANSDVLLFYIKDSVSKVVWRTQRTDFATLEETPKVTTVDYYVEEAVWTTDRRVAVIISVRDQVTGKYLLQRLESTTYA